MDLVVRLRSSIRGALPDHISSHIAAAEEEVDDEERNEEARVGIAQSAMLCIDVLARKLTKHKDWVKPMTETLVEFAHIASILAENIYVAESSAKLRESDADSEDLLKILGSTVLCCGSLCGVSKARALPQLSVRQPS